jgi:hypothetical protein
MRKQVLLPQQSSVKTKLFESKGDSLNFLSLFTIVVCPWTSPPFKLRYAKVTSTLGSFTTIIIAIPLPTECAGWTDGYAALVLPDPGARRAG